MSKSNSTVENNPLGIIVSILIGSLVNIIIFFGLTAVFSLICLKADTAPEILKYPVWAASGVGGFFGGLTAVGRLRKNGMLFGAASAVPALLVIILVCTLVSRTGISYVGWIAVSISVILSAVGGILSANRRK